jgi:glutathione S-transferase
MPKITEGAHQVDGIVPERQSAMGSTPGRTTAMPAQAPLEIFGTPFSNFVRAVRTAIAEKGLAYDYLPVRPHSSEAEAVHPLGLVPGLRHGEVVLGESQAVITYLDGLWPERPMGPSGPPAEAAEIAQWISIVATTVDQVLIRRYVVPYAFPKGADGSPDPAAIEAVLPDLRNVFTMLETRLSGRDYLAANRFTLADALLVATLNPALRRPEAAKIATEAPAVRRYFELHSRRPSFVDTAPSG